MKRIVIFIIWFIPILTYGEDVDLDTGAIWKCDQAAVRVLQIGWVCKNGAGLRGQVLRFAFSENQI
ncbi:hypothetical protein [Alloalcanivorax dieselolei]|uniref:hypothetical protein n=1 Tax=Alloalcanivorax dieselolei TaxID=285091 RepID=UPI0011D1FCF9|nr:hypothetical protein [Alloalcanivorax dieselolei]